jgi:hypothetical protein
VEVVAFRCRPANLTLDQGVIRQVESERMREKGKGLNRDDGLECQRIIF